jgi:hypothetical protein
MSPDIAPAVGAAAFWAFVAVCVVSGAVAGVLRNRENQKTIRQAIESGQTLDPETLDRLLRSNGPPPADPFGFLVGGLVLVFIGVGLPVMGWFISIQQPGSFYPMVGVGSLVGLLGIALIVASAFARKSNRRGRG